MIKSNGLRRLKKKNSATELPWYILNLSFFIALNVFLVSCGKKITAEAPTEIYDSEGIKKLNNKISYLSTPIEIDIDEIENQINQNFKGLIYADSSFQGDDLKYKIWKDNDLSFKHRNQGVFDFEVPLKIWVEKRIKVLGMSQTAETDFQIVAKFSSKPFISADWHLETLTNSEGFQWITQPRIRIGGLNLPVTGLIESVLGNYQSSIARIIDEEIAEKVDLSTPVLEVWNQLKVPIKLSEEYNLWLRVIPQDVLMTKLSFKENKILTEIAIKALVQSSVGLLEEEIKESLELPPLKFVNTLPKGYSIYLYNLVTFNEAENIAKSMLLGQKLSFGEGREIEVLGIRIYGGANNKVIIQTNTDGDLKGTIFMEGDPFYDEIKRAIVLKNVKFNLKTKNLLAKTASWLMEGSMSQQIENNLFIPIDPIFEGARESIDEYLNYSFSNGLKLSGQLLEILPGEVYLESRGLMTTVEAKGNINVKIGNFASKK